MTRTAKADLETPHEVRLLIPAEVHQDLKAMSAVSGLAVSVYIRALVTNHVAKTYQNIEKHDER